MKAFFISIIAVIGSWFGIHNQSPQEAMLNNSIGQASTTQQETPGALIAQEMAEETQSPPTGYLTPSYIPTGFSLVSTRFTASSTSYAYEATSTPNSQTHPAYLQFSESANDSFDKEVALNSATSTLQDFHEVKGFTFQNGRAILFRNYAYNMPTDEYWLYYDHMGRLVTIHVVMQDGIDFDSGSLVQMLETATM